ncbi:MAG: SPFH/Band 7/PHB domain protein [Chloroflexi bacterium]|nr:SPFH/Band 7/PHB domain protein [Chloroflexota bacterium]
MDALYIVLIVIAMLILFLLTGIRIVRPTHQGLIERFGKYQRTTNAGFNYIIPVVDRMVYVNITEQMVDVARQTVITKDKLNAEVDALVYYQIVDAKASAYNVDNHRIQLTSLARTTLRAVIGKMTLTEANENRNEINAQVEGILGKETKSYGVNVLRVEIQSIDPPHDVQMAMNEVVKAEQKKIAATDIANALEIESDGKRRALIKEAEGFREAQILKAQGEASAIVTVAEAEAEAIKKVSESSRTYFKEGAVEYKRLETTEASLKNNSKIVIDGNSSLVNVIGDLSGLRSMEREEKTIIAEKPVIAMETKSVVKKK